MTGARAALLLVSAAALAAAPAAGDWLVMRDGTRLETRGPWEVKGAQVVFTLPGGRLSALRAADVDLEASAAATRAAAGEAGETATAAAEPKKAARVITNASLAPAAGEAAAEEAETAGEEAADATEPAADATEPVRVVAWSRRDSEDGAGLEIVGTLRNTGAALAADIGVRVTVRDQEGRTLLETRAFLGASALAPGATTGFRALAPGLYVLSGEPSFEVSSDAFSVGAPPPPEDEAEAEDEDGAEEGGGRGR